MLPTLRRLAQAPASSSTGSVPRKPRKLTTSAASSFPQKRTVAVPHQAPINVAPRKTVGGSGSLVDGSPTTTMRGGTDKSLWQSWLAIPPRTRMTIGMCLAFFSISGMILYPKLEEAMPVPKSPSSASDQPHKPRLFAITTVDRKPKGNDDKAKMNTEPAAAAASSLALFLLLPTAVGALRGGTASKGFRGWQRGSKSWFRRSAQSEGGIMNRRAFSTSGPSVNREKSSSSSALYLSRSFSPIPTKASSPSVPISDVDTSPGSADESLSMLVRGGYIRQSSSGIFTFLPPGVALLENIERIISEEMEQIHASRVEMPTLLSNKLWKKSGRDVTMGSELYRLKDRRGSEFVLGPTHEEEVTKLVGGEIHSYKQLPVKVYQITRKHRDEPRPRLGLLRTREFIMKDLYTFDASIEDALQSYKEVQGAYKRIMDRLFNNDADGEVGQNNWRVAQADSGAMGGILSHEYHVEDKAGEDNLLVCSSCSYTANSELASSRPSKEEMPLVASDVHVRLYSLSKDPVSAGKLIAIVSPGSAAVNEVKVAGVLRSVSSDSATEVEQIYPTKEGEVHWDWKDRPEGPVVRFDDISILADHACASLSPEDLTEAVEEAVLRYSAPPGQEASSSSEESPRLTDFFPSSQSREGFLTWHDLRLAQAGSACSSCSNGTLAQSKAIELGHTFLLGTRYSKSLGYQFASKPEKDPQTGKQIQERNYFQMGCYGIGLTRLMGVLAMKARRSFLALEQQTNSITNDENITSGGGGGEVKPGFRWPDHLAPHTHAIVLASNVTLPSQEVEDLLVQLRREMEEKDNDDDGDGDDGTTKVAMRALIDDRPNLSLGAKLTEADLSGAGQVWIVGKKGIRRVR